jgi:hypothetical protein
MVEQHPHVMFRRNQIADRQRDRACRQEQSVTQRDCVIGRASIFDTALGSAHCLSRKPLQPQDPRKEDARHHPQVDLKANEVRFGIGNDVISEHALDMAPGVGLFAQIMLRDAHRSLADQPIVRIGPTHGHPPGSRNATPPVSRNPMERLVNRFTCGCRSSLPAEAPRVGDGFVAEG